ncbi:hypothetical protein [Lacrimispora amygdalina]|uniref:hypothetical protein n=1 Tax=Lacrimispora amygdalina TaxID=253257 RepID=UPI000BE43DD4|nr:hypothetical protein [Lacrimispora amygdalina]
MKIKKILYLSIAVAMFSSFQVLAASADISAEGTENAGTVYNNNNTNEAHDGDLVWSNGERSIYYDPQNDTYEDSNGTVSKSELVSLGIIPEKETEPESLASKREIKLNISTVFDNFDVESSDIHNILLTVTGELKYDNEEEVTPEFTKINLSRDNNFTSTESFECTDRTFSLFPYIPNDYSNAYTVSIKYNDEDCYNLSSDVSSYDVVVHLYKPDHTITDANKAPTIADNWEHLFSGKYSESRAEELELDEETETIKEGEKQIENKNHVPILLSTVILALLSFGGLGSYLLYKRANKED